MAWTSDFRTPNQFRFLGEHRCLPVFKRPLVFRAQFVVLNKDIVAFDHAQDLIDIQELRVSVEKQVANGRAYLLTQAPSFQEGIHQVRAEITNNLQHLKDHFSSAEGKRRLSSFEKARRDYEEALNRAISLRMDGAPTKQILRLFETDIKLKRDVVERALLDSFQYEKQQFEEGRAAAGEADSIAAILILMGGIIALFVGMSLLFLIRKTMKRVRLAIRDQERALAEMKEERTLRERFVDTLSHDLRNPLAAARMAAQLLARKELPRERMKESSERMIQSLNRADRMIQNLLDISRVRAGEKLPLEIRHFELGKLVRDTLLELAEQHGDRFVLISSKPEISGYWSYDQIQRVIENLVGNAIKYGASQKPIRIELSETISHVSISVINEGPVIPSEHLKHLFVPYYRTEGATCQAKGWGLGLALVKAVAEAHSGTAQAESSPEAGTIFTITLPKDARPDQSATGPRDPRMLGVVQ